MFLIGIAACLGQACFLIENCDQTPTAVPTPPPMGPPVISGLTVTPLEIIVGGRTAQVSATITDPDGHPVSWQLTVATGSEATGTFAPPQGTGGSVSSAFSPAPTASGEAKLTLSAFDREGGTASETVSVVVIAPRR
jgi:hypothetical protein